MKTRAQAILAILLTVLVWAVIIWAVIFVWEILSQTPGPWPSNEKKAFLDGCNKSGFGVCDCVLGRLQKQFPDPKVFARTETDAGQQGIAGPYEVDLEGCSAGGGDDTGIP